MQYSQYSKLGKSISDSDFESLVSFANNSADTAIVDFAKSISNKSTTSNSVKGELAARVQQSIASKLGSAKTAQELTSAYNQLTLNRSGYIISLANRAFAVKAAALNLDENAIVNTLKTVDGTVVSQNTADGADNAIVNDINRSDNNAGQDPGILAGSGISTVSGSGNALWQQGENTANVQRNMGYAPEAERNNDIQAEGRGSAWLSGGNGQLSEETMGGPRESLFRTLRNKQPSGTDTKGRTVSKRNQERLAETVFKTEDGQIIVLYHWTPNKFDEFKYGDGAYHAGTLASALSIKGKNQDEVQGYLKEIYVISKHPLIIKDVGGFGAYNITEQLQDMGLLDDETFQKITKMDGFFSDKYDAEANVYLREYLKELGFDSYLYQNIHEDTGAWSVGVFDADQIITVAENGVLKENSGVTQADSDGSASVLSESDSGITELSAENPKYDMIEDIGAQMAGTVRMSDQQRLLVKIGKAFGVPVRFANLDEIRVDENGNEKLFSPHGDFDEVTGVITLNTSTAVKHEPVKFVLKHELVHFGNINKKAYKLFVNAVKDSKVFEQWLKQKTKMKNADANVMLAKLSNDVRKQRAHEGESIGPEGALEEIIADFAGDVLFEKSGKPITELIESLQKPQRPLVLQYVVNAFEHLIGKLKGTNDGLTLELRNLQSNYVHMLKQAQKNPTTQKRNVVSEVLRKPSGITEKCSIAERLYCIFL